MKKRSRHEFSAENKMSQFCTELNRHLDRLEASAIAFLIALSPQSQYPKNKLGELLDPQNIMSMVHDEIVEIEFWFEKQVNTFLRTEEPVSLPTGWINQWACNYRSVISEDIVNLSEAIGELIEINQGQGLFAVLGSFFQDGHKPETLIIDALTSNKSSKEFKAVRKAAAKLERDANNMRQELSQFIGDTWNNDIVPMIR